MRWLTWIKRSRPVPLPTEPGSMDPLLSQDRWAWTEGHPMGKRPRSWFGLEDHDGTGDPVEEALGRRVEQHLWDIVYRRLPWHQRCACSWRGQLTEPVGHHG